MSKQTDALKLALEAWDAEDFDIKVFQMRMENCREALAEQPAQQQGPVISRDTALALANAFYTGGCSEREVAFARFVAAALRNPDEPDYKALWQQMCERCDELDAKLAQQRKPLVWLTDEEAIFLIENESLGRGELIDAIEAKLREKNQ